MNISLWKWVAHSLFIEGSHATKNTASDLSINNREELLIVFFPKASENFEDKQRKKKVLGKKILILKVILMLILQFILALGEKG
jgi:hypothetical protein